MNHVVSLTSIATGWIDVNQSHVANAATPNSVRAMLPGVLPEKHHTFFLSGLVPVIPAPLNVPVLALFMHSQP